MLMSTSIRYDTCGMPLIDPYPILNDYRVDPYIFWETMHKRYKDLDQDVDRAVGIINADLLLHNNDSFLEPAIYSSGECGWTFHWTNYYIPIPNQSVMVRLKCLDNRRDLLYFKAKALSVSNSQVVEYLKCPSISPTTPFVAYEKEDIGIKWRQRILNTKRRQEFKLHQLHNQAKLQDETYALFICAPGKTYLMQDCYWGSNIGPGGIPDIKANKQILLMSDDIYKGC